MRKYARKRRLEDKREALTGHRKPIAALFVRVGRAAHNIRKEL